MGIRCSLTGHRFEETEVERERDEDGDKVVITTKEYDVCLRCGQRSLNNETTEVTSTSPDTQSEADIQPDRTEPTPEEMASPAEPEDAGIIIDDGADTESTTTGQTADATATWSDEEQPAEDQSQPADPSEPTSEADQQTDENWPAPDQSDDDQQATEPTPWPEHEGDDQGVSADSPGGDDADVEYVGLTPTSDGTAQSSPSKETPLEKATTAPAGEDTAGPSRTMDLVCPACGFTDDGGHGSLRRGDICPDCLDGYLTADGEHNK